MHISPIPNTILNSIYNINYINYNKVCRTSSDDTKYSQTV